MVPVTSAITDLEELMRHVPPAQRPAIEAILVKLRTIGEPPRDLEARMQFLDQVGLDGGKAVGRG